MNKKLELLNFVTDYFKDVDLSDVCLVACQHLLGTTSDMLDVLFSLGLSPRSTFMLGKSYSTHASVVRVLERKGVWVSPDSSAFDFRRSFDDQFEQYVSRFIKQPLLSSVMRRSKKIIVLDDGGKLIRFISDLKLDFSKISGVEQTTSGYESIRKISLRFPVVNLARAKVKLKYESPYIAAVALNEMKKYFSRKQRVLLIGGGSIGNNIYKILKKEHKITIRDYRKDRELFPGKWAETIGGYDVIIGATGATVLDSSFFKFLKGKTILASVSSSDREFDGGYFRKLCKKSSTLHAAWEYGGTKLLNAGFPVNFSGKKHSLPPVYAQLTRALLIAGVVQAYRAKGTGLVELDSKAQEQILKRFKTVIS